MLASDCASHYGTNRRTQWHSRNAETCTTLCIYCVQISVHANWFDKLKFASCTVRTILELRCTFVFRKR